MRLLMFCSSLLNTNPSIRTFVRAASLVSWDQVPKVIIQGVPVEFEHGKLPYQEHGKPESILDICLNAGIHLEHACGGNCACTTCHVVVTKGEENLSEADDDELDRLDMAPGLTIHSRLGCQAVVEGDGDIELEIPSWNRNYVSEGGGSMNLGNAIPAAKR
jgi:ferredoxin, 2Fe-2S